METYADDEKLQSWLLYKVNLKLVTFKMSQKWWIVNSLKYADNEKFQSWLFYKENLKLVTFKMSQKWWIVNLLNLL